MSSFGRVIGGAYLDASVSTATFGSDLVVQTGIKGRKLNADNVKSWEETHVEVKENPLAAIGKAAAGVALPGRFGKVASAAVGAAFDSKLPDRYVRVDWVDGKQSLLKLPDALFMHIQLVLSGARISNSATEVAPQTRTEEKQPTIADKTFDLVSGFVKDRFSSNSQVPRDISAPVAQVDVAEQLHKLASLRNAGILTDEEFVAKKAELLAKL
jgi:hypothetical protein